jgi:pimeloyl-ACP methyl ester carboxylesterase
LANVIVAHGAWSSGWAWKKVRPLMAAAGHQFFVPSYTGLGERGHLANPSNDLETHIQDVLGVIQCEELRDIVLIGHSYGGIVATGVADRARDRIAQLIYLDAFVPKDGQALIDLVPERERIRMRDAVKNGDGWRLPPNPSSPDTSPEDLAWVNRHRLSQSIKCFEQPVGLQGGLTVPRGYIYCTVGGEHRPFTQFAEHAKRESDWRSYEIEATHSPNVTAPEALVKVLQQAIADGPLGSKGR